MQIIHIETLIAAGSLAASPEMQTIRTAIHAAIKAIDWPPGSGTFTIYPESGKKRGEGNGVVPIKIGLREELKEQGWRFERPTELPQVYRPGPLDAVIETSSGLVAVEWETGNISSSHRALSKLVLGLRDGVYIAGVLVLPSKKLGQYLTDRIGNLPELRPYFRIWRDHPVPSGVLEIIEVEHDAESVDVRKIPKGTDGRAQG